MTTRTVVSKSAKRTSIPTGSKKFFYTQMVVYRTKYKNGSKTSITKHEIDLSREGL